MSSVANANVADNGIGGQRETVWPAAELASALSRRRDVGIEIEPGPVTYLGHSVKVDLILHRDGVRVGVVCDEIDSRRLGKEPGLADSLGLDAVLCVSTIDVLIDSDSIATDVHGAIVALSRASATDQPLQTPVESVKATATIGAKLRRRGRARAA